MIDRKQIKNIGLLFVDGDHYNRKTIRHRLEYPKDLNFRYKLYVAQSIEQALLLCDRHPEIKIVLTEIIFNKTAAGIDFIQKLKDKNPYIEIGVISDSKIIDEWYAQLRKFEIKHIINIRDISSIILEQALADMHRTIEGTKRIKVFISYAREDVNTVKEIVMALNRRNYNVWFDIEKLLPGLNWEIEIAKAVDSSHFFIACMSSNSVNKEGYVQKELKIALNLLDQKPHSAIYLIPTRLDDCVLPISFRHLQWCDMCDDDGINKLIKAIEAGSKLRNLAP